MLCVLLVSVVCCAVDVLSTAVGSVVGLMSSFGLVHDDRV
jgi:hypothetical protein